MSFQALLFLVFPMQLKASCFLLFPCVSHYRNEVHPIVCRSFNNKHRAYLLQHRLSISPSPLCLKEKKESAFLRARFVVGPQAPATFRDCSLFSLPSSPPPPSNYPNDKTSGSELVQMGPRTSWVHSVGGQPPAGCGRRQAGSPSTRSSWPHPRTSGRKPRCPSR